MKLSLAATALLLRVSVTSGVECGAEGSFTVAGSTTVFPIADLWAQNYQTACSGTTITVEGGGSSTGAGRVCGNVEKGTPIEIGDMSREWDPEEATLTDEEGGVYTCVAGDPTRSVIQVDVAIDGITVATSLGGAGDLCITALGGLTLDQLRWIFSSYTSTSLIASGWDATALANSDGDDTTHLWSELSADCPAVEIKISGPDSESGTNEYFLETILIDFDNGETFDTARPNGYTSSEDDEETAAFLAANEDAIGYFGYAYYNEHTDTLSAAAVQDMEGAFVVPDPTTVADGTYNPLSRRIYMNVLDDEASLAMTVPFLQFGFSDEGSALVEQTGYVVIPDADKEAMLARLPAGESTGGDGSSTDAPDGDATATDAPDGEATDAPDGDASPTDAPAESSGAIRVFSVVSFGVVALGMILA